MLYLGSGYCLFFLFFPPLTFEPTKSSNYTENYYFDQFLLSGKVLLKFKMFYHKVFHFFISSAWQFIPTNKMSSSSSSFGPPLPPAQNLLTPSPPLHHKRSVTEKVKQTVGKFSTIYMYLQICKPYVKSSSDNIFRQNNKCSSSW